MTAGPVAKNGRPLDGQTNEVPATRHEENDSATQAIGRTPQRIDTPAALDVRCASALRPAGPGL